MAQTKQKHRNVTLYLNEIEDADIVAVIDEEMKRTKRLRGRVVKSLLRELIGIRKERGE